MQTQPLFPSSGLMNSSCSREEKKGRAVSVRIYLRCFPVVMSPAHLVRDRSVMCGLTEDMVEAQRRHLSHFWAIPITTDYCLIEIVTMLV